MYDAETASLIGSSPALNGLDLSSLPEQLSEGFARIAAARLRLRTADEVDGIELSELISYMQRLAFTNEALVAISPNRSDRAAAAFVAGSAHQLCFNARRVGRDERSSSYIDAQGISPDIAAMLLFLAAEATADASELSTHVGSNNASALDQALIES